MSYVWVSMPLALGLPTDLLNFARPIMLRIAGSSYQRPDLHLWTMYNSAGEVTKETDHILISVRWMIIQNFEFFLESRVLFQLISDLLLLSSSSISSLGVSEHVTTLFQLKNYMIWNVYITMQ